MRFFALRRGENAVVIDVHLVEVVEECLLELRLRHLLKTGESVLEEMQGVSADPGRDVSPSCRAEQEQFPAENLRFGSSDEAVVIQVESVEQLVRTIPSLLASEIGLLLGDIRGLNARLGRTNGYAERGDGDEHLHSTFAP
jgi:hypothetical protein